MTHTAVILEDETIPAEVFRRMLRSLGFHEVYIARSAVDALNAARDFKPDIALLDIGMEYADGDRTLDGMWAAHWIGLGGTPIAFVTGYPDRYDNHKLSELVLTLGYKPCLVTKPVTHERVLEGVIKETLERALAARQDHRKRTSMRDTVFVSYSHRDKNWCDWLYDHIKYWAEARKVNVWIDRHAATIGEELDTEIANAINRSRVAIALISDEFLKSRIIRRLELPSILAAVNDGARLIPLIVDECDFKNDSELSPRLALNPPSRSLSKIDVVEREHLWIDLLHVVDAEFRGTSGSKSSE